MPRSQAFHAGRQPLQDQRVPLGSAHISGPLAFCNPTRAHFPLSTHSQLHQEPVEKPRIERLWRSRDNRKGRHALTIHQRPPGLAGKTYPRKTIHPIAIANGILRMFTTFPYWDISFWVALVFTVGSGIWVINAFFVWLPLEDPSTEFANEVLTGGGVTAFIGATVFEFGSILLVLEAVNENQTGCFGWAVETAAKKPPMRPKRPSCESSPTGTCVGIIMRTVVRSCRRPRQDRTRTNRQGLLEGGRLPGFLH